MLIRPISTTQHKIPISCRNRETALSSHLALPHEGHLDAVFHVFAYLECWHNARIVYDPNYPDNDMSVFKQCDWKEFYGVVEEAFPLNAPEPHGCDINLRMFIDSDYAGDKLTWCSCTGFIIYLLSAPIVWYSKKQLTIETNIFGAELVAMKQGMEALWGLCYKLRMMGVEIFGPSYIYVDNMSVIHNTQWPELTLKKKSNSVCYHAVHESVAMGESLTGHVSSTGLPRWSKAWLPYWFGSTWYCWSDLSSSSIMRFEGFEGSLATW